MSKFSAEDLTRWKTEINPAPILSARGKVQRENQEWVVLCPFHDDHHPSCKFYKQDDGTWTFKCFSCAANGNIFQWVQKKDNLSFTDAVTKVLTEAGISGWQDGQEQEAPSIKAAAQKPLRVFPITEYVAAEAALERAPAAQKWLANRGIGMEVAREFHIGFLEDATRISPKNPWAKDGWVSFPTLSEDRQTVTAIKYRSLVGKKIKGEKRVSGIIREADTSTTLYNLQAVKLDDDVWIVEGEPDTLVLAQAGLTAVGYPTASYTPTDEEWERLSSAKRRFLAGDNDKAGEAAMEALKSHLTGQTFRIKWPNDRKDANDVLTNECGNDPEKFRLLLADLAERATQTTALPMLLDASEIKPKRIHWLWDGKIPLGKITVFAGNPDNGKSLAGTSIASFVSRGEKLPGSEFARPAADVIMLIGEDDIDDTVIPRLIAAKADRKHIKILDGVRPVQEPNREVRLDRDIPALEHALKILPNVKLIVIDPISNYLGEVSMVAEQEVRSVLIPLKRLAEKHNLAVVIIMHLNKKNDLEAINRIGGAMAFTGVARASWLFSRNPRDPEQSEEEAKKPDSFSMLKIKNNIAKADRSGMGYFIDAREIPIEGETPTFAPFIEWTDPISGTADEVLNKFNPRAEAEPHDGPGRPNDEVQEAMAWLERALQDGEPHATKALMEDAQGDAQITHRTLERAKKAMPQVKAVKKAKVWCWQMMPLGEDRQGEDEPEMSPQQRDFVDFEGVE